MAGFGAEALDTLLLPEAVDQVASGEKYNLPVGYLRMRGMHTPCA